MKINLPKKIYALSSIPQNTGAEQLLERTINKFISTYELKMVLLFYNIDKEKSINHEGVSLSSMHCICGQKYVYTVENRCLQRGFFQKHYLQISQ